MVLERLNYYKKVAQFAGVRAGHYLELTLLELALYKSALTRSIVGYVVMAFCGVFALAFLSIAVLVSFWDTDHRIATAWWIFGTWCVLAIIGLIVGKNAMPDEAPSTTLSEQIKLDIAAIKGEPNE